MKQRVKQMQSHRIYINAVCLVIFARIYRGPNTPPYQADIASFYLFWGFYINSAFFIGFNWN